MYYRAKQIIAYFLHIRKNKGYLSLTDFNIYKLHKDNIQ